MSLPRLPVLAEFRRRRQRRLLVRAAARRGIPHMLPPRWQPDGTVRRVA